MIGMSAQCIRLETNVKMVNDTFLEYLPFFSCQVLGAERKASSQISRGSQPLVMAEWWWLTATTSAYRWGSVATCFTVIAQKWIFRRVYSAVHSKQFALMDPIAGFLQWRPIQDALWGQRSVSRAAAKTNGCHCWHERWHCGGRLWQSVG